MKAVLTEHEMMLAEVMTFTNTVVGVVEMTSVPAQIRAEAIGMAEKIFQDRKSVV